MADYPNPNIHRGQGISGRGLLIAGVVLAIFALSFIGTSTVPASDGLGEQPAVTEPAIQTAPVPLD
jgi:hypothetical protein